MEREIANSFFGTKTNGFSIKKFDNKIAPTPELPDHNAEKRESCPVQKQNISVVPYTPFSDENKEKTKYDSEMNHDYAWEDNNPKIENNQNIPIRYLFSGGTGVIFALVNSCFIFCAFPQNHIYLVPKAWHEFMTTSAIGFTGLFSASLILNCEIWMNIKGIRTWKNFILLYLISAFAWMLGNIGYYHIYCVILDLSPPMPLNIHICSLFIFFVALSCLWLLIPADARSDEMFWTKYGYYILAQVLRYVAIMEYFFITWLFVALNKDYQWCIAIILPILREINGYVFQFLCFNVAWVKNNAHLL